MEKRQPPSYTSRPDRSGSRNPDAKQAVAPPPEPTVESTFQSKFASLSLHKGDLIRLLDFPEAAIELIRQAIRSAWPSGLQDEREAYGSFELKLKGYPWLGRGDEAMHARRLMRSIFENLFDAGWILSLSTDVTKKNRDHDTMIFRYQDPAPTPRDWICISFSKMDRLRVMDAPPDMLDAIYEGIRDVTQEKMTHSMPNVWEVKLRGFPWEATVNQQTIMDARRLLLRLCAILEAHGFTVYASIDQKRNANPDRSETDTWHCCRPKQWSSGAPVYHA